MIPPKNLRKKRSLPISLLLFGLLGDACAQAWPPLIWPLCHRLGEAPGDWQHGDRCDAEPGDVADTDLPIHNGFGFRNYVDANRPISFHRGIDLGTRAATTANGYIGNPVFAICSGYVYRISGDAPDQTLELKCPQQTPATGTPAQQFCSAENRCITAVYRHVQNLLFSANAVLQQGDHIAYTSSTAPNGDEFAHLHFEILNPNTRPSSADGGRTAFSKDAENPLRWLPIQLSSAVTVAPEIIEHGFADYPLGGPPGLTLRLTAQPGFQQDFAAMQAEVFVPGAGGFWQALRKDAEKIAIETETQLWVEIPAGLARPYTFASGSDLLSTYDVEELSHQYSPFSSNSSLWSLESGVTWYRALAGGVHPGLDGFMERNADGYLSNGQHVHDFDFRLIQPNANPNTPIDLTPDPATWWGFQIGFRDVTSVLAPPYCVRIDIDMLPSSQGQPERHEVSWRGSPSTLDCEAIMLTHIFANSFDAADIEAVGSTQD